MKQKIWEINHNIDFYNMRTTDKINDLDDDGD